MKARRFGWYGGSFGRKAQVYRRERERKWGAEKNVRAVARNSARTFDNTHEILLRENGEYLLLEVDKRGAKVYASLEDLMVSLIMHDVDVTRLKQRDKENVVDHNN